MEDAQNVLKDTTMTKHKGNVNKLILYAKPIMLILDPVHPAIMDFSWQEINVSNRFMSILLTVQMWVLLDSVQTVLMATICQEINAKLSRSFVKDIMQELELVRIALEVISYKMESVYSQPYLTLTACIINPHIAQNAVLGIS